MSQNTTGSLSGVKAGDEIRYIGKRDSDSFYGSHEVVRAEETYQNINNVPDYEKGKLMIVILTHSDMAFFWKIDDLQEEDWEIVNDE